MLTSHVSKAVFQGNGAATQFPFTFKVWEASHLAIEVVDEEGIEQDLSPWTVELSDTGGILHYRHKGVPLPQGYILVLLRNMPFTQEINLVTGTRFDPAVIEAQLDKATAERQELREITQRAVVVPPSSEDTPKDYADRLFTAEKNATSQAANAASSAAAAQEHSLAAQAFAEIAEYEKLNAQIAANQAQNYTEEVQEYWNIALSEIDNEKSSSIVALQHEGTAQRNLIDAKGKEQLGEMQESVEMAKAWAQSDSPPDPSNPNSRSAKWWAEQAGQGVPDATAETVGKVRLATAQETSAGTGTGVVVAGDLHAVYSGINSAISAAATAASTAQSTANSAASAASNAQSTANGKMTSFVVQDGDGTDVTINNGKYLKFIEGSGVNINFTDVSTGSSSDPYDITIETTWASETVRGAVERATNAEASAGTDTTRYVTPYHLKTYHNAPAGAPLPQTVSGVGQWSTILKTSAGNVSLPTGGTWFCILFQASTMGASIDNINDLRPVVAILPGGSYLTSINNSTNAFNGFIWRIA